MKRIGIFGGSFNPPHRGHMHLAESVREALALDEVWLIPSKISPHRSMDAYAPEADRLAMCRLAAEEWPWLHVSDYELQSERVSYTWYTVEHFAKTHPDDELWLLMGSDMLLSFSSWYRWQDILRLANVAGIARAPGEDERLNEAAAQLSRFGEIRVIQVDSFEVSSTKIREMVRKGSVDPCYLSEKIVQYIEERHLYAGK